VVHDWQDQRYAFDIAAGLEEEVRLFIPVHTRVEHL
jgi:hypothetical protein